jgi:uncharacterized protein
MVLRKSRAEMPVKIFLYCISGALGGFVASTVLAAWLMIKPNRRKDYDCIPRISHDRLEPLVLTTSDGLQLHAWVQLSSNATSNDWVLLLHGYRSDRAILQTRRRFFNRRGFHTLLLHFRGHGSSEAARISYGFNERKDVRAAFEFIRSLYPDRSVHIGIDGVSMGAAAAAYATAFEPVNPDWLILESCYDNIRKALANRLALHMIRPFIPMVALPLEFVAKHVFNLHMEELNPAKALERIHCPVLVLAGDSEKVLKTADVESLFASISEPKRLVFFPGGGHEDFLVYDPRRFITAVTGFLREFTHPRPEAEMPVSVLELSQRLAEAGKCGRSFAP